jgi:hypothetical protein
MTRDQNHRLLLLLFALNSKAQDPYVITGKIYDSMNKQSLAGASKIKGANKGTVAKEDGSFQLKRRKNFHNPDRYISLRTQEFTVADNGSTGLSIH